MADVDLVLMPYANVVHPSIGVGMLTACLKEAGIQTKSHYANLRFAEIIGVDSYFLICELSNTELLGEWSFAGSAFPDFESDHLRYFKELVSYFKPYGNVSALITEERLWRLRNAANAFIDSCAESILSDSPRIVGCSSVLQQHCASLAILKRIREMAPEVVTMLGGANCEGSLGLVTHRCFNWVDFVVSGEADLLMPDLCRKILHKGKEVEAKDLPVGVLGPCHRSDDLVKSSRAVVSDLDKLPVPDYYDYFEALERTGFSERIVPGLLVETSRGCWWSQKHQCAFCGLNGCRTGYRSKSADRVIDEFVTLSRRHGVKKLEAVDNIMDMKYFRTVIPALSRSDHKYNLIYETTASLRRQQVRALADAGIRFIQAGIESMHDEILTRLNKGNRAWMNIGLLKWAQEFGVHVAWNFLVGVPGESDRFYQEMAEWLPLIYHLQAPTSMLSIRFDRFSAYHQNQERYALKLVPSRQYSYVYPLSSEQLMDFAYFFENHSESNRGSGSGQGLDTVRKLVKEWRGSYYAPTDGVRYMKPNQARPVLNMRERDGTVVITDTRPCAVESEIVLDGLAARIYRICDSAKIPSRIVEHLDRSDQAKSRAQYQWDDIRPVVDALLEKRIMIKIGERLISLAVREPQPLLPSFEEYAGGILLAKRVNPKVSPKTQNALAWFGARHNDTSVPSTEEL